MCKASLCYIHGGMLNVQLIDVIWLSGTLGGVQLHCSRSWRYVEDVQLSSQKEQLHLRAWTLNPHKYFLNNNNARTSHEDDNRTKISSIDLCKHLIDAVTGGDKS